MASSHRDDLTGHRDIAPGTGERASAPASITVRRRIDWIDSDPAGIAHWMTALRLVESAETDLHQRLGILDHTYGAMPRVHVSADFRRELRVFQHVDVHLQVADVGTASLRYRFEISADDGEVAVEGELVGVYIDPESGGARPWASRIRAKLLGSGHVDATGPGS